MTFFKVQVGQVGVWIAMALDDNYLYLLEQEGQALVVDPSDARVVRTLLAERGLNLQRVLVTHHHQDHIFGLDELRALSQVTALGPRDPRLPMLDETVEEGSEVRWGALTFRVLHTPGHAASHVVYYEPGLGLLFSGDTLFVAGCGRLMEGTAAELYASLQKLKALPDSTRLFCGHNYAVDNLRFAMSVEPNRPELAGELSRMSKRTASGMPSVPSTLGWEKQFNVFLRAPDVETFAALRARRNDFG